jgi:hypothetical protein
MARRLAFVAWWALMAVPVLCCSQSVTPARSAALECMTPPAEERNHLQYPPDMLERKDGGTVEVELTFEAPDEAPQVDLVDPGHQALRRLEQAVRDHVRRFRVPCLKPGSAPVKLRQIYDFVPNDGRKVVASEPRDPKAAQRHALFSCMRHVDKLQRPEYPANARRKDQQGPVLVFLRFTGPDAAPELKVLASPARVLEEAVESYVAGLRLPCYDGEPAELNVLYQYKLEGGSRLVIPDTGLAHFLAGAREPLESAYFDFGGMGCPFDLRVKYMRPYLTNTISELDNTRPQRRPFMDWLSRVTLKLTDKTNSAVLGQTFTVHVPCGTLDL